MSRKRLLFVLFLTFLSHVTTATLADEKLGAGLDQLLRDLLGGQPTQQRSAPSPLPLGPSKRVPFGRDEMQLSFAPLVKAAAPSVVNVYTARVVKRQSPFIDDPFFGQFFGDEQPQPQRMQSSLGSGVLVDPSGLVVTNNHVIRDADEVKIALADGREFECAILLKDERSDLAVLKISANEQFPALNLADSDAIEVGDLVLAIGNPFGVGPSWYTARTSASA